jgi:hypothetical protein
MTTTIEGYLPLPKESFIQTEWLGPEGGLDDISPRWQGYTAHLPDRGETILYPLRESNFGRILPHIYAEDMHSRGTNQGHDDPLSRLNLMVNSLFELNGGIDFDKPTNDFQSLLNILTENEYSQEPELSTKLLEVFAGYKEIRERQKVKIARGLTRTAKLHELYVVAYDATDKDSDPLLTGRLSGVVNVRKGDKMNYRLVVSDTEGNEGLLPPLFSVPGGVCAPAAG